MSVGTKAELRRLLLRRRAQLPKALRHELSQRICSHLLVHPWLQEASAVHLYCSFGSEVETHKLCWELLKRGKRVAIPLVSPGELELRHVWLRPGMVFHRNRWGIPEPVVTPAECLTTEALGLQEYDLVLVPLVAYDRDFYRLGYGGGYYDRFLRHVRARRVGLAFSVQAVEQLPREPHDIPLDAVATEEGIFLRP